MLQQAKEHDSHLYFDFQNFATNCTYDKKGTKMHFGIVFRRVLEASGGAFGRSRGCLGEVWSVLGELEGA